MIKTLGVLGFALALGACGARSPEPVSPETGLPAWDGEQVVCGENVSFQATSTAPLPEFAADDRLGFCARAMRYIALHREHGAKTSYFGVAAATVASLASTYAPLVRRSYSDATWALMAELSAELEQSVNAAAAQAGQGGLLSRFTGGGLDTASLIRTEQQEIQTWLDNLASRNPEGYATFIEDVNGSFNPTNRMLIAGIMRQPLYGPYEVGLAEIRARQGGAIDFAQIAHRLEVSRVLQTLIERLAP